MNFAIIFSICIGLILLRVLWLKVKANSLETDSFKNLPAKDQLAILKECLLNNPTKASMTNLGEFLQKRGQNINMDSYKHFFDRQLRLYRQKDAIAEDNELYAQESIWMDQITPLEFEEAEEAKKAGDSKSYIEHSLEGIARLYSDEAIEKALNKLIPDYPKAETILKGYLELVKVRDNSLADESSLESLRKLRDSWEQSLLSME